MCLHNLKPGAYHDARPIHSIESHIYLLSKKNKIMNYKSLTTRIDLTLFQTINIIQNVACTFNLFFLPFIVFRNLKIYKCNRSRVR